MRQCIQHEGMDTLDTSIPWNINQEAPFPVETQNGNGLGVEYVETSAERFRGVIGPLV